MTLPYRQGSCYPHITASDSETPLPSGEPHSALVLDRRPHTAEAGARERVCPSTNQAPELCWGTRGRETGGVGSRDWDCRGYRPGPRAGDMGLCPGSEWELQPAVQRRGRQQAPGQGLVSERGCVSRARPRGAGLESSGNARYPTPPRELGFPTRQWSSRVDRGPSTNVRLTFWASIISFPKLTA